MKSLKWKVLAAGIVGVLVLAGCTSTSTPGPDASTPPDGTDGTGGTDQVAWSDRTFVKVYLILPGDIDPHGQFFNIGSETVVRTFYESLIDYNPESQELEGVLASSWEASDDAQTFTFNLREGVQFHDGSQLTAEAVQLSFERIVAQGFVRAQLLRTLESVEVVDDLTVRVHLSEPDAAFLANIPDLPIVSAEAIKTQDDAWFLTHEAGSGAYKLAQPAYDPNADRIIYEPFPEYWRGWGREGFVTTLPEGAKHLGRIEMRHVPEAATQRLLLEQGEAQFMAGGPLAYRFELADQPNVNVIDIEAYRVSLLPLNVADGPLTDIRLRQMLKFAFPYDTYINDYYRGRAIPAAGPVNPELMEEPTLSPAEQDLDRAAELLAEAGYGPGELTLTYAAPEGQEEQLQPGILLQDALAQIGVKLDIVTMPFTEIARLSASGPENTPDIMTLINTPKGIDPGVGMLETFFHPKNDGGPYNWGHYNNPRVTELLDDARRTLDESRFDLLREAQQIVVEDVGALFLSFPTRWAALSSEVGGYWLSPIGIDRDNWYDMYWNE